MICLDLPKERLCKGIIVRCYKNTYFHSGVYAEKNELRILRSRSCKQDHEGECDFWQFGEDIQCAGPKDMIKVNWGKLKHQYVYQLTLVMGGPDWETGYVDDWWWEPTKIEKEELK